MKRIIPIIILLALCATILGQSKPGSIAKHSWSKYDKAKDRTELGSNPVVLNSRFSLAMTGPMVELVAYCTFPGDGIKGKPENLQLAFMSKSKGLQFIREIELIFLLDGQRLSMGKGNPDADINLGGGYEYLSYQISPADLKRMAAAKTVELQLGSTEMKLKDKHLENLRAFASLLPK